MTSKFLAPERRCVKNPVASFLQETAGVASLQMGLKGVSFRKLREKAGLSQDELAAKSGVNKRQIQSIEAGHSSVGTKTAARVADLLGVSQALLLGISEDERERGSSSSQDAVLEAFNALRQTNRKTAADWLRVAGLAGDHPRIAALARDFCALVMDLVPTDSDRLTEPGRAARARHTKDDGPET